MPLTTEQRQRIVDEAMSWVTARTPYRGWSAKKGVGADCGQIIHAVYVATGHLSHDVTLPKDYRLDVAQHRASTDYVELVAQYMSEISEGEAQPGDVVVYKLGLAYAHGGIIVQWPDRIIDAQLHGGVRIRHGKNLPRFLKASKRFFTLREEFTEEHKDAVVYTEGVAASVGF